MKVLHLNLKKKWFDMELSGEKPEEYREITEYWVPRLLGFLPEYEPEQQVLEELIDDLNNKERRHDGVSGCLKYFGAFLQSFDVVDFKNGYARNGKPAPQFTVEVKGIEIREGKEEWGAEPGKIYFVITLGKKFYGRKPSITK